MKAFAFLFAVSVFASGCLRSEVSICEKYPPADLSEIVGVYEMNATGMKWKVDLSEDASLSIDRLENGQTEGTPTRSFVCIVDDYLFVEVEYELIGGQTEYFSQAFRLSDSKIQSLKEVGFWNKVKSFVGLEENMGLSLDQFSKRPVLRAGDELKLLDWPKETELPKAFALFEVQMEAQASMVIFKNQNLSPDETKNLLSEFLTTLRSQDAGAFIRKTE